MRDRLAVAHLGVHTPDPDPAPATEGRLDSWKEIAAYLRRDVRTVQRWEKAEGLPVRRHQHLSLGSVYAYRHELEAWREGRRPLAGAGTSPATPGARPRGRAAALGGLVLLAASAGAIASRSFPPRARRAPVVVRTVQLTSGARIGAPVLATDGARLFFSEKVGERLTVTALLTSGGEPETVPLSLSAPVVLDVSPDGSEMLVIDTSVEVLVENVLYASPLYRVPAIRGAPRRVGEVVAGGASWLPDGRSIVYTVGRQLKLVDRYGVAPRTLVQPSGVPACARASPDGRLVRFSVVDPRDGTWSPWEIAVDGTALRPLLPGWSHGQDDTCGSWSSSGDYFFMSSSGGTRAVWFMPGKQGSWEASTEPWRLTFVPVLTGGSRVSRDGHRFFLMAGLTAGELVRWDSGSREFVTHPSRIPGAMVDFSRDGAWLVYVAYPSNRLWRARADGTERRPLTEPPLEVAMPRWSPDGTRLVFQARSPGQAWKIYGMPAGGGRPVPLVDGRGEETDPSWSPDGRSLVYAHAAGERPDGRLTLRILDLATGKVSEVPGSESTYSPRWSPDGRHVAALPADWQKLLLLDLETGRWSAPVAGDLGFPTWSRDGSCLYYQTHDDVIHRLRLSDGRTEVVVSRTGVPRSFTFCGAWFGLDPDDRLLLMRETGAAEVFAYDFAYR